MKEHSLILILVLFAALLIVLVLWIVNRERLSSRRFLHKNMLDRVEHARQSDLLKAIISTQEQERSRIAANLHDSVGAELSMLKLNLSRYAFDLNKKHIDSAPLLKELENLDETIDHIRNICKDLYPVTLQSYGFIRTFEELVAKINSRSTLVCRYKFNIKESDLFTDLEAKLNLLRLFQEIVNNLLKYAECSILDIGFMKYENDIKIILRHNGLPFDNDTVNSMLAKGKGLGLASINNRIFLMKGKIDYCIVNNGSEIIISLPITNDKKD